MPDTEYIGFSRVKSNKEKKNKIRQSCSIVQHWDIYLNEGIQLKILKHLCVLSILCLHKFIECTQFEFIEFSKEIANMTICKKIKYLQINGHVWETFHNIEILITCHKKSISKYEWSL